MRRRTLRFAALAAGLALTAAACGDDNGSTTAPTSTTTAAAGTEHSEEMMPLPDYAKDMKTAFASPATGLTVTDNVLPVTVTAAGFDMSCDWAGKPLEQGKGHYHLLIDKSLINMYCTPDAKVSLQNVKPGKHELEVVPALNDHAEVLDNAQTIEFDYQPASPLPEITDQTTAGAPTIKVLSPKAGDVVSGTFDVVIQVTNWVNNCDLYGKPGVAGYGHWHVNLDSSTGPMMGMGTMLGMSCDNVFHATTTGLKAGEKHTVIALLVDNGHAPLSTPVEDKVEVTIG